MTTSLGLLHIEEDESPPELPPRRTFPGGPPPLVHKLYEELTETWQYVVADPVTRHAVIIDPHLDNAPASTDISTIAADRVLATVRQNHYIVDHILHTHEPNKHPSSAWYIRTQLLQQTGRAPKVQIGKKMAAVQRVFRRKYSMNDGSQWKTDFDDSPYTDGEIFEIGQVRALVLQMMNGQFAFVMGMHIFAGASRTNQAFRNIFSRLDGDADDYYVHTSSDRPPERTAKLTPVFERRDSNRESSAVPGQQRKLVIRYAATDLSELAELEG